MSDVQYHYMENADVAGRVWKAYITYHRSALTGKWRADGIFQDTIDKKWRKKGDFNKI